MAHDPLPRQGQGGEEPTSPMEPPPSGSSPNWNICSNLPFQKVVWPRELSLRQQESLALALNITGSFEGRQAWGNISNNFDGQGMSLGLLQQNLGQGSLQPLLIAMQAHHQGVMEAHFSADQLTALGAMLTQWQNPKLSTRRKTCQRDLWEQELSALDFKTAKGRIQIFLSPRNQASVEWAKGTLYSRNSQFLPVWKRAFQAVAQDPEYVSQQIGAALKLHRRAESYMVQYGFRQRRSYLFFFDIAVQNGGIPKADWNQFLDLDQAHPEWQESQRLAELLEIRLRRVNPRWRQDVRSRKTTIIEGVGQVHGRRRNLPEEFCYSSEEL